MEQEKLINLLLGKELSDRQLDAILKKGMGCGKVHPEKNCTHDGWGVIENLFAPTYLNLSTVLSYILLGGITIICFSCFIVASQKEETLFLILAFSLLLLVIYLFTKEDRAKYALMKKRLKALETQNANALREKWESRYESIHGEKPKFWKNLKNESDAFLARFFCFFDSRNT